MRLPISTQINIWGQQLKEFDYWLMFADFKNYPCFQQHLFDDRPGNSGEGPRKERKFWQHHRIIYQIARLMAALSRNIESSIRQNAVIGQTKNPHGPTAVQPYNSHCVNEPA